MMQQNIPAPGFGEPVADAQRVFRATLEALARPLSAQEVTVELRPPQPLSPMMAALVLTLCDAQTPVWLDPELRSESAVESWIRFHTGAPLVDDVATAMFCVVTAGSALPPLAELAQGTDEEPHLSATVIIDAANAEPVLTLQASGPGIKGTTRWDGAGLDPSRSREFLASWSENHRSFPRGVDLIFAGPDTVRGLPRTTELTEVN